MTPERGPKLGKRAHEALDQSESSKGGTSSDPEELIDFASIEEESGDRWRNSDLSKALRFYQRAFEAYTKALELSEKQTNLIFNRSECYYNAVRLLFQVYCHYTGSDCVDMGNLSSALEVLQVGLKSVLQDLNSIAMAHERAINLSGDSPAIDLLYNAGLVYIEVVENLDDDSVIIEATIRALILLRQVFTRQVEEFQEFLQSGGALKENQVTVTTTAQPADILDTGLSLFNLFRAYIDTDFILRNDSPMIELRLSFSEVSAVIEDLLNKYPTSLDLELPITQDQRTTYIISREYLRSTQLDFESACLNWDSAELPETAVRYMSAADSVQSILDRSKINLGPNGDENLSDTEILLVTDGNVNSVNNYWAALSKISTYLKKAQNILETRSKELKKSVHQKELGTLILQVCTVYIARADIDQQRSQLRHPEGQSHRQILKKNVLAFLENVLVLSSNTGGIRETTMEKLLRGKRLLEANVRLLILEGKLEEIKLKCENVMWKEEYDLCKSYWFYN